VLLLRGLVLQGVDGYTQSQPKLVGTGASGYALQGSSTAVSGDGMTACVGGYYDNNQIGAVWMYTRVDPFIYYWTQQGSKLVPSDYTTAADFGFSCSLNYNGTIAVIGGKVDDAIIGATWVFTHNNSNIWAQQGGKLVGTGYVNVASYNVLQGWSVSLASTAGKVFVTGGPNDNSWAGAAWVFSFDGATWSQVGVKLVGAGASGAALQGWGVAISADAITIAVGGPRDASSKGAVWIFTLSTGLYSQQGSKFTATPVSFDFGNSVALSYDGSTLIVGAYGDNGMFVFTISGI
jgi:hypothetical protein